jgi:hypothetical protein
MTLEELKKLIADDEGETVEVKETTGKRGDACETLCAFLNYDPPICDSNPCNLRIAHVLYLCKLQWLADAGFCICQGQGAISG